jgi:Lar family restriction alleviation protein
VTEATLAPCPFCGSGDVLLARGILGSARSMHRMARCRTCDSIGPRLVEADAIAAWNRRASSPDHDLAAKALSAAMALNNALGALLAATNATERACAEHAARAVRAEIARQFAAEEDA